MERDQIEDFAEKMRSRREAAGQATMGAARRGALAGGAPDLWSRNYQSVIKQFGLPDASTTDGQSYIMEWGSNLSLDLGEVHCLLRSSVSQRSAAMKLIRTLHTYLECTTDVGFVLIAPHSKQELVGESGGLREWALSEQETVLKIFASGESSITSISIRPLSDAGWFEAGQEQKHFREKKWFEDRHPAIVLEIP